MKASVLSGDALGSRGEVEVGGARTATFLAAVADSQFRLLLRVHHLWDGTPNAMHVQACVREDL
jgi:hypothetical protein